MLTNRTHTTQGSLSTREQEVLKMIAFEYTTKEIASELFLSEATIETHRRKLFHKLEVRNAAGLIRRAFECGILQISVTIN